VVNQPAQSWRSNQLSNQMLNSKGFSKHYISNEKPKIRVESNDATDIKPQARKTIQAQYNNLLDSNPEQQAALSQLRKSVLNRHVQKQSTQKESLGSSLAMSRQTLHRIAS
jgi:hypothetical protein